MAQAYRGSGLGEYLSEIDRAASDLSVGAETRLERFWQYDWVIRFFEKHTNLGEPMYVFDLVSAAIVMARVYLNRCSSGKEAPKVVKGMPPSVTERLAQIQGSKSACPLMFLAVCSILLNIYQLPLDLWKIRQNLWSYAIVDTKGESAYVICNLLTDSEWCQSRTGSTF